MTSKLLGRWGAFNAKRIKEHETMDAALLKRVKQWREKQNTPIVDKLNSDNKGNICKPE